MKVEFMDVKLEICCHSFKGERVKTLMLSFASTKNVLSSMDGFKRVQAVCNTCAPEVLWGDLHRRAFRSKILKDLKLKSGSAVMLSTGVDVENYGISMERYRDLSVCAIATAGVKTNAMRVGVDRASAIENNEQAGTINTVILTDASLSKGAMVGSIITSTEGKTIALQDLDIRSCYSDNMATGTGTDSVVVVSGKGGKLRYAGGHTKLGELVARAVAAAVKEAIRRSEIA